MQHKDKRRLVVKCAVAASLILLLFTAASAVGAGQTEAAGSGFIARSAPFARQAQQVTGVPASVTLAQAILESNWGTQPIPGANNYFGIKAFARANGTIDYGKIAIGWVWCPTLEWNGYRNVQTRARFRKYKTMGDSFLDHAYFFLENPRYATALRYTAQPQEFARQIARAGYATDPNYASQLIGYMNQYNLYQYDVRLSHTPTPSPAARPSAAPAQNKQLPGANWHKR